MGLAVTTVASGGLPVKELAGGGIAVTEVASYGLAVTKVTGTGTGMGVTFVSATGGPAVMYATLNPADVSNMTLSGGNLTATASATQGGVRGVAVANSGKVYWEITVVTISGLNSSIGIAPTTAVFTGGVGSQTTTAGVRQSSGTIFVNAVSQGANLGSLVNGEVVGLAIDFTASPNLLWIRKAPSGNWNNSGTANPATPIGGFSIAAITGVQLRPFIQYNAASEKFIANFGASAFVGAVPSGFTAGWPA